MGKYPYNPIDYIPPGTEWKQIPLDEALKLAQAPASAVDPSSDSSQIAPNREDHVPVSVDWLSRVRGLMLGLTLGDAAGSIRPDPRQHVTLHAGAATDPET